MINYERWKEKLIPIISEDIGVNKNSGEPGDCFTLKCEDCLFFRTCGGEGNAKNKIIEWLYGEDESQQIDWSKVAIDTPILVSMDKIEWYKRHYAGSVSDGMIYAWQSGNTSWSNAYEVKHPWRYAKLP